MPDRHVVNALILSALFLSGSALAEIDIKAMEALEETTESLANHLHKLSVAARSGDAATLAYSMGDPMRMAVPTPGDDAPLHKWVRKRSWRQSDARSGSRDDFVDAFQGLLDHYAEVEDVRFKLTSSDRHDRGLRCRFKSFIVGRNRQGQREWFKGYGALAAAKSPADGTWILSEWAFDKAYSKLATKDLFNECSGPAGVAAESPRYNDRPEAVRSHGAAAADVNGDGLVDVFATGETRNFLYINRGDGRFDEVGIDAGVGVTELPGIAPIFIDYDNDGDLDLFVTMIGPQRLFENRLVPDGELAFYDVTQSAGVGVSAHGFSATAGDVNGDGLPDIYVASYNDFGPILPNDWAKASNGTPNLLFINRGGGRFDEAAAEMGVAGTRWSYAATIADLDRDGRQDIFVANDFGGPVAFYRNEGGGRFKDVAVERGLGRLGYGMGVSVGDYDNDGDFDLHVTKMSSTAGNRILSRYDDENLPIRGILKTLAEGNTLYENLGDGKYKNVSAAAGPFSGSWAWGGGFIDLDNDGYEDLYTPNGFISQGMADT